MPLLTHSVSLHDTAALLALIHTLTVRGAADGAGPSFTDTYRVPATPLTVVGLYHADTTLTYLVFDDETEVFRFEGSDELEVSLTAPVLLHERTGSLKLNRLTVQHVEQLQRAIAQGV